MADGKGSTSVGTADFAIDTGWAGLMA